MAAAVPLERMSRWTSIFGLAPGEKPSAELPIFVADVARVVHLPGSPWRFLMMLLGQGFRLRLGAMATMAVLIGLGDSFAPYMFGNLVNVLTSTSQESVQRAFFLLIASWITIHVS